jgi:hypothetical protein
MHPALTLLLCAALTGAEPAPPAAADNLDFRTGTLAGWEGKGFYVTTGTRRGPSFDCGVCSSDRGPRGHVATLHRTFVVPPRGGVLQCFAAAHLGKEDQLEDNDLDIVLLAAGKRVIPKHVRVLGGWQTVGRLQTADRGRPREYVWHLDSLAGQTLRIALIDEDRRPGCHVWCSGFRLVDSDVFEPHDFTRFMLQLTHDQKLPPAARFDSEHFMALSNADDSFTELRLQNCELIYDLFYRHFRAKGFILHRPSHKLMVAIFDSPAGFDAYVGQKMPSGVAGLYHMGTNRLVVYDLGLNRAFLAMKRQAQEAGRGIGSDLDRMRYEDTVARQAHDIRTCANIEVIMHEVAHQLSFNSGMLNRDGDAPAWLAEGLATYCEATDNGAWQGIGEMNPERMKMLVAGQGHHIPLRDLVSSDEWLHGDFHVALLGYAQSWALFGMFMEERPHALRDYLTLIYNRAANGPRFRDFCAAFGDPTRVELRYEQYMSDLVDQYRRTHKK